jgi:hypothetical protein
MNVESSDKALLNSLIGWFSYEKAKALKLGRKLSPSEVLIAQHIGCSDIAKIRICFIEEMPRIKNPTLLGFLKNLHFELGDATGLCLGHGIYTLKSAKNDRSILAHELTHTKQFEELRGTKRFLKEHISQFMRYGYRQMPLEKEARKNEKFGKSLSSLH